MSATLKLVDAGDTDYVKELADRASELRKLHKRTNTDTLTMATLLHDVMVHRLVTYEPGYDPDKWAKKPDGIRAATVDWYRREVGPIAPSRVNQLVNAGAVVTMVTTGQPAPTSERQIRPLTKLLASHRKHIPKAWTLAHELADGKPVTSGHVTKAAKQIAPDAFTPKPKTKVPGTVVRKANSKAAIRKALSELLDYYDQDAVKDVFNQLVKTS